MRLDRISSAAFGLGIMWLIWNVIASLDPALADSPLAANWPASLGLIALGVILDFIRVKRK